MFLLIENLSALPQHSTSHISVLDFNQLILQSFLSCSQIQSDYDCSQIQSSRHRKCVTILQLVCVEPSIRRRYHSRSQERRRKVYSLRRLLDLLLRISCKISCCGELAGGDHDSSVARLSQFFNCEILENLRP